MGYNIARCNLENETVTIDSFEMIFGTDRKLTECDIISGRSVPSGAQLRLFVQISNVSATNLEKPDGK